MMGKTRKVSKGCSFGFVPDYRHAVETMADSEGFGSLGQVDTEMTTSDDPCAPKRKCINLNADSYQHFGVPIQVLSISKLSSIERKELGLRLKHELEQVRTLQKNIATVSYSSVALSPSSDVHSCSAGQRGPIHEFLRPTSIPTSHSKKRVPPGRNGGQRPKKAAVESVKKALPQICGNAMLMKQCETLLNRLMGHNYGWVFNSPVDIVALKIPDYYTVIKHPMDLGTIKTKLTSGKYVDPLAFAADVRLTFSNAMTYNPRGNNVHIMAETMSKFFEVRWKVIEKKLPVAIETVVSMRQNVVETETVIPMPPFKKKKTTLLGNEIKQEPVRRTMSDVEKLKLSSELESLLADLPANIIDFLKENSSNENQTAEDEIEIDIDTLCDDTLFKLRKLLDEFLADKQTSVVKTEACDFELHNGAGFNNSSMQECKANDANDEDVDIGGNDLPISSFPPVEIEKDTVIKNSKCNSSSSSSSDSGSSSSESDSDTSSGSHSDGAKVSAVINNIKETMESKFTMEQTKAVSHDAEGQVGQKSHPAHVSGEVDGHHGGESASSERQVSPDKLYRAALLRSRFADTILKAQEKTIGKVDKQDRERLRLEKEELERRRKEEKARLLAEAKAAEEARRNAELEAAAEAKRKRELEREAARQALQKMEKMVDINDNSLFLEDLEMLSAEQPFVGETSADCCEDGFNLNGKGNPLEQLGLYMKDDQDEDDEEDLQPLTKGGDDPEEGEID